MKNDWIWLSHVTSDETPAYGGGSAFSTIPVKQMCCGDSCNTVELSLSNHIGSHVDAPRHFIAEAKTVEDYSVFDWIFEKPLLIDIPSDCVGIIEPEHLDSVMPEKVDDADLVLLRTVDPEKRNSDTYYKSQPGFSPDLCEYLESKFDSFNAIGLNAISISSFLHRNIGRLAHRAFLGSGIRIFEDLALFNIPDTAKLNKVIALPFRYRDADGSPVTVLGDISYL